MSKPVIPMEISTPRLLLRAPQAGEGAEVFAAVQESLTEMQPWIDWVEDWNSPERVEEIAYRCRVWFYNQETFTWRVYLRETERFVGTVELHSIDWDIPRAEIGYWQRTSAAGQGLMTEAVEKITMLALQAWGFKRLQALCDARNTRAIRLVERLGFEREGLLRRYEHDAAGELCDIVLLAKIAR
jgi:RimJ/RimL family protein N-acetyltransferase